MYRKPTEIDAYLRVSRVLIDGIDRDMERLLSFLPSSAKQPLEAAAAEGPRAVEGPRAKDLEVQRAIDKVLKYHRTHRPKNTTKNYLLKQRGWKVSIASLLYFSSNIYIYTNSTL
jgi:hypothetical protein